MDVVQPGDVIMATHVDRFARSAFEGPKAVEALNERGIGVVSLREQVDSRETSSVGRLTFNMLLVLAQ